MNPQEFNEQYLITVERPKTRNEILTIWLLGGEYELPIFMLYHKLNNQFMAQCRSCDRYYIWEHEVHEFDYGMSYCGSSYGCCP